MTASPLPRRNTVSLAPAVADAPSVVLRMALLGAVVLVAGCGSDAADPPGSGGAEGGVVGEPLDVPERTWTYVAVEGMVCRDGSPTGVMVNRNPESDRVLLWLEEGQACFNSFGCNTAYRAEGFGPGVPPSTNPFALYQLDAAGELLPGEDAVEIIVNRFDAELSVYNRTTPNNPFVDWSYVFVPYCSGDIHLGNAGDVSVAGSTYQFRGWVNTGLVLDRIAATWPRARQFVIAGSSAGGFGAGGNYARARAKLPQSEVILVDDSGAYMGDAGFPPCLLAHLRQTWNLDATVFADCPECSAAPNVLEAYITHVLRKFPDFRGGLIDSEHDGLMRTMIGFGANDCAELDPPIERLAPLDAERFRQGLVDFRDRIVKPYPGFRTFYTAGEAHTFIDGSQTPPGPGPGLVQTAGGTTIAAWLDDALNGGDGWRSVGDF